MKKIAIVGCGGTGHALAAILSRNGHKVYLTDGPQYQTMLEKSREIGRIRLTGTVSGVGRPESITPDIGAALSQAELIIVCTISTRDEEVAQMICPYVTPEKPILISAGNGASLIFHRIFEQAGKHNILVGETGGNFFPCRLSEDRTATIGLPLSPKKIAAFPPKNTPLLTAAFQEIWDFTPADSILCTAFDGPNLICHMAGTLLNISKIENSNGTFSLFQEGISPGVINLLDALWQEKCRVFQFFDFEPSPSPRKMFEGILDPSNDDYRYFREMDGPGSLEHRYITEDAPYLTCFFISIARAAGIPVPLFESMTALMSAVTGTDFYREGRTLENLGLGDVTGRKLISYFCSSAC